MAIIIVLVQKILENTGMELGREIRTVETDLVLNYGSEIKLPKGGRWKEEIQRSN